MSGEEVLAKLGEAAAEMKRQREALEQSRRGHKQIMLLLVLLLRRSNCRLEYTAEEIEQAAADPRLVFIGGKKVTLEEVSGD